MYIILAPPRILTLVVGEKSYGVGFVLVEFRAAPVDADVLIGDRIEWIAFVGVVHVLYVADGYCAVAVAIGEGADPAV